MQETHAGSPVLSTQYSVLSTPEAAPRRPVTLAWPRLVAALLTGGLLFASYFPLNCGWLAWVALVPLLGLVRSGASKKRLFFCGWAGGLVFYWPVLQWMRHADTAMYATWAALATYCALFVPAAVLLLRRLDRTTPLPLVVTVPAVWMALELFRSHVATGFSWYLLGHTQHDFLPVIQVTDLGGVYAVSALVAAVNALLFEVLYARPWFRRLFGLAEPVRPTNPRRLLVQGVAVALLLGASLGYGVWRLGQNDFEAGPRVALVQSNLDLRLKNDAWSNEPGAKDAREAMQRHQIRLTALAVKFHPELIVWPETSWPSEWYEVFQDGDDQPLAQGGNEDVGQLVGVIKDQWRTDTLLGMNTVVARRVGEQVRTQRYNSAVLITAEGQPGGRYDKIHRVPFGEYVPLRDWLPFMDKFSPYNFDYSIRSGERLTRFPLGRYHYGVLICYEDTVDYLAREYALPDASGPAADFLLNTSNDGWFDGSSEHDQHLAICRFRAVEARRTVGRSVNMGISAVVDPNGRVLAPRYDETDGDVHLWEITPGAAELSSGRWGDFKKVTGVLVASLPIDHRASPYARLGDWLPWGGWLVIGAGVVAGYVRRRRPAN